MQIADGHDAPHAAGIILPTTIVLKVASVYVASSDIITRGAFRRPTKTTYVFRKCGKRQLTVGSLRLAITSYIRTRHDRKIVD